MKKTWQNPKLIVLVRSKPEEMVLTACKYQPFPAGSTPGSLFSGCLCESLCVWCDTAGSS